MTIEELIEKEYMNFRLKDMSYNDLFKVLQKLNLCQKGAMVSFLKECEEAKLDHGKLYTILIAMKGYPKKDKELHAVMEHITDQYKAKKPTLIA